jgi:hypothetical protein
MGNRALCDSVLLSLEGKPMKTFECHYNGAVLTVSAENKADAERYAGYILGVGKRTWLLYVREMR